MHVLRLLRIFIPLLLVAAIVAGTVLVLTSRSELQQSRKDVDVAWSPLRSQLDDRYRTLTAANRVVRDVPGPLHQIVTQVAAAYAGWHTLEANNGSVTAEVSAANTLESLGRRLVQAAGSARRLADNAAARATIAAYAALSPPDAVGTFNAAVAHFEKERNRPARRLAARILGYSSIPAYETTSPG